MLDDMVLRPAALALTALTVIGFAGCDSGPSTARSRQHRTTTTTRRHRGTTTTSSSTSTSSPPAIPSTAPIPATTVPPTPPTTAPSNPGNCGARAGAIYAAVQGGDLGPVPLENYTIANCRVSTANPIWSAVTLVPHAGSGLPPLIVALERVGSIWQVRAYGQDHVACDAPAPVPTELQLGC